MELKWKGAFSTLPFRNPYTPILFLLLFLLWKGWKGINKKIGYEKINIKFCKRV